MRKLMTILAAFGCAFTLASCAGQDSDQKAEQPAATAERPAATPPQRAAVTAAPTPAQIVRCVSAGLTADRRTEAQARHLPVGAEVTINGAKQRLAAGQSYWSLCSGPSVHERLAAAERNLAAANRTIRGFEQQLATITAERDALLPLAYTDPAAARTPENTWKHQAEQDGGFGWLSWLIALMLVGTAIALFFFGRDNYRLKKENADLRFQLPRTRSEEPVGGGGGPVTRN